MMPRLLCCGGLDDNQVDLLDTFHTGPNRWSEIARFAGSP